MADPPEGLLLRAGVPSDVLLLGPIELAGDQLFVDRGVPGFDSGEHIADDAATAAVAEGRLLVAVLDGEVIGWVHVDRSGPELYLEQICVHPDHHGRGVGAALLRSVIEHARVASEPSILLNTESDIPWNRPWYEHFGFEVVPEDQWRDDMREMSRQQSAAGHRWNGRVHMRLVL